MTPTGPDAPRALDENEIRTALRDLADGWSFDGEAVTRDLSFRDFNEAFGFMARVALLAEAMGHHPEWSNVYKSVSIRLRTHDANGVSSRDLEMARAIDRIAGERGRSG